jgi:acetyl coenzyme A synthetase (ADP forming)-like protein
MLTREPSTNSTTLDAFFAPHGVAVIGASHDPTKLGHAIMCNLLDPKTGYPGPVYPVNPKVEEILGLRCYADISSVPDPVELAIIIIPAEVVPGAIEACGQRGIKAALIISGGFCEVGEAGAARQQVVVEIARRYRMRLMGPNGIGVIDTYTPLNTTFVPGMPARGNIAFLSQSGALCGGIIDWIIPRGIGFSRLLSVGNEADLNESDLLPCLAADKNTQVITLYLEDVKDGPRFIASLGETAAVKPVLAIKAGRTASGQIATASHTGALASAHAAFRAACRQTGAIECDTVKALFDGAMALSYQPLLAGRRIAILTNAGGPAALAADHMELTGLTLARTSADAQAALRTFLSTEAQVAGPVDMLGGATEENYRQAFVALSRDEANDGILVILVPQALVNPEAVVNALAEVTQKNAGKKPLALCLMGEASLEGAYQAAQRQRIPAYTFPDEAIGALGVLHQRAQWLATPRSRPTQPPHMNLEQAHRLLASNDSTRQGMLDAVVGQALLTAIGIATPPDRLAKTPNEAAAYAKQIGFPVALKLVSPDIVHKTDIGGVLLPIENEDAARAGFQTLMNRAQTAAAQASIQGVLVQQVVRGGHEVIVGMKRDPTFGPLVMFGMGGIYAEALADVSFRLAPLTHQDVEEMISEVRSAKLLAGLRGAPPADRGALIEALIRIGWLAESCPQISELDINPLIVLPKSQGVRAVDARIVVH